MRKLFFSLLLLVATSLSGQIAISNLPTFNAPADSAWVPGVVGSTTYKIRGAKLKATSTLQEVLNAGSTFNKSNYIDAFAKTLRLYNADSIVLQGNNVYLNAINGIYASSLQLGGTSDSVMVYNAATKKLGYKSIGSFNLLKPSDTADFATRTWSNNTHPRFDGSYNNPTWLNTLHTDKLINYSATPFQALVSDGNGFFVPYTIPYVSTYDTAAMLIPYKHWLAGYTPQTRLINTTAPLIGGGSLGANITLSIDTGRAANAIATGGSLKKIIDSLSAVFASQNLDNVMANGTQLSQYYQVNAKGGLTTSFQKIGGHVSYSLDTAQNNFNVLAHKALVWNTPANNAYFAIEPDSVHFHSYTDATGAFNTLTLKGSGLYYNNQPLGGGVTPTIPSLQQVTEVGASTDQDVLFEFRTSYGDALNANRKAILRANNIATNSEVFNLTGFGGDIATRAYADSSTATKQNTLVSGINIKTVNGNRLLGSGDIVISGGGGIDDVLAQNQVLTNTRNIDANGHDFSIINGNIYISGDITEVIGGSVKITDKAESAKALFENGGNLTNPFGIVTLTATSNNRTVNTQLNSDDGCILSNVIEDIGGGDQNMIRQLITPNTIEFFSYKNIGGISENQTLVSIDATSKTFQVFDGDIGFISSGNVNGIGIVNSATPIDRKAIFGWFDGSNSTLKGLNINGDVIEFGNYNGGTNELVGLRIQNISDFSINNDLGNIDILAINGFVNISSQNFIVQTGNLELISTKLLINNKVEISTNNLTGAIKIFNFPNESGTALIINSAITSPPTNTTTPQGWTTVFIQGVGWRKMPYYN